MSFAMAVLAPITAVIVNADLLPVVGHSSSIPTIAAVVIVAWLGGLGPGLLAGTIAIALEVLVILPPYAEIGVATLADRLHLVLLAGTLLLVNALAWLRGKAEQSAVVARHEAEDVIARADVALRRLEALQHLATDLGDAETDQQMIAALLSRACVALQADRCVVGTLEIDGGAWRIVDALMGEGAGDDDATHLAQVNPRLIDVIRDGERIFDEGRSPSSPHRGIAVAAVPLRLPTGPGALAFMWAHPHPLPAERQAFIEALARAGSAALDRHRMFAAEVAALRRAEAATGFLNVLADAGRTLGATLAYDDLVALLPGLGVPQLGDVGILDLEEGEGEVRRVIATHDPSLRAATKVLERYPLPVERMGKGVDDLEAGRAVTFRLDPEVAARSSRGEDHGKALRELGTGWLLLVPLTVQGATAGVLTFLRRTDEPFDPGELFVAEELGRRAGRALENALLLREVERFAELDRRRAAELEAVLGAVEEGFLVADSTGAIRSSNRAAERVLGGPVATLDELLNAFVDAAGRSPRNLPSQPEELRLRRRPNAWAEIAAYNVEPSTAIGMPSVVVVVRDVTAFRRGQALREAFLGLLSHELRTPVTTIYAAASVLTRRGRELDPRVADEVLGDVAAEANRLFQLIEDLMVLARFDEGIELGAQPVLLQHLVPSAVSQEASRWPAVSFDCAVDPDLPTVGGDETAIAQVVRNLLSNAAKYSPAGGHVHVSIHGDDEGVAVAVRDEGPGIDPAELERIFEPFFRSPSTAGLASGAGIGLYVSHRLVDAMGGHISAGSANGGGSEFTFTLPPYQADEAA
jgi:signal transduction histidine kinase